MKRSRLDSVIGRPPARARWSEFKYFPHSEGTIDGRVEAARVKRFMEAANAEGSTVPHRLKRDVEASVETMMLCAGTAPQKPADVPWHIQYLAANQFIQDFHASRILPTDDALARFSSIVLAGQAVGRALDAWEGGPEAVTARRLADLLGAGETPRVVRELIRVACESIGVAAVAEPEGGADPAFEFPHPEKITPALIRRRLPKMLRKVGHWHLVDWMGKDLEGPAEEGGE